MKRRDISGESGFTIIELLLAIAVSATLIIGIIALNTTLSNINKRSRMQLLASFAAEAKIEELRSSGYNSVAVGTTTFSSSLVSELGPQKTGTYTVSQPATGYRKISVTISYKVNGQTKTQTQETFIGETGVGQ